MKNLSWHLLLCNFQGFDFPPSPDRGFLLSTPLPAGVHSPTACAPLLPRTGAAGLAVRGLAVGTSCLGRARGVVWLGQAEAHAGSGEAGWLNQVLVLCHGRFEFPQPQLEVEQATGCTGCKQTPRVSGVFGGVGGDAHQPGQEAWGGVAGDRWRGWPCGVSSPLPLRCEPSSFLLQPPFYSCCWQMSVGGSQSSGNLPFQGWFSSGFSARPRVR